MPVLVRDEEINIGTSYVPYIKTFQISECHTEVTTYDLSDIWGISLSQATRTLKKTMQKFLRSAFLPLARRYCNYIVFTIKKPQGQWSCETMNGRYKSMDGDQYEK